MPFLLFLLLVLLPTHHALKPNCPVVLPVPVTPRIIGGSPVPPATQHLLELRSQISPERTYRICTASLLTPTWAITAAHCNVNSTWSARTQFDVQGISISAVHEHPSYRPTLTSKNPSFDIALLRLSKPPPPPFNAIALNANEANPFDHAFLRVQGFGSTSINDTVSLLRQTQILTAYQVDLPAVPFQPCLAAYSTPEPFPLSETNHLCAGYIRTGACDSCTGDSGGPLLQYTAKKSPVLLAIVSSGKGCARPGFPGINIRIAPFLPWIRSHVPAVSVASPVQKVLSDQPDAPPTRRPSASPTPVPAKSPSASPMTFVSPPPSFGPPPPPSNTPVTILAASATPSSLPPPVSRPSKKPRRSSNPVRPSPSPGTLDPARSPTSSASPKVDSTPPNTDLVSDQNGNAAADTVEPSGTPEFKEQVAGTSGDARLAGIVAGSLAVAVLAVALGFLALRLR